MQAMRPRYVAGINESAAVPIQADPEAEVRKYSTASPDPRSRFTMAGPRLGERTGPLSHWFASTYRSSPYQVGLGVAVAPVATQESGGSLLQKAGGTLYHNTRVINRTPFRDVLFSP